MKRWAYGLIGGLALVASWYLYFRLEEQWRWQGLVLRHPRSPVHVGNLEWWEKALLN